MPTPAMAMRSMSCAPCDSSSKPAPLSAAELEAIGFALVIFPGGIVRALGRMAGEYYGSLAAHGTTEPFRARMLDFDGLNELIGTPEMLALGKRYDWQK